MTDEPKAHIKVEPHWPGMLKFIYAMAREHWPSMDIYMVGIMGGSQTMMWAEVDQACETRLFQYENGRWEDLRATPDDVLLLHENSYALAEYMPAKWKVTVADDKPIYVTFR